MNNRLFGQFPVDEEYEIFVHAWMAYHRAANAVDWHVPPGHPDQAKLGRLAVQAGHAAMSRVTDWRPHWAKGPNDPIVKKWHRAKLDACRRLGL